MNEERQCYYIVRENGSVFCYLKDNDGNHVLADTLNIEFLEWRIDKQNKVIAELRAQVAERDAMIAQLRAQLATVPVDCIRRYYAFTNYDAAAANDAGYTTQQFDSDDMWIGIWLESLEDAA